MSATKNENAQSVQLSQQELVELLATTQEELKLEKDKNKQYELALKMQIEKYDNLFNLFANNVDYIVNKRNQ